MARGGGHELSSVSAIRGRRGVRVKERKVFVSSVTSTSPKGEGEGNQA